MWPTFLVTKTTTSCVFFASKKNDCMLYMEFPLFTDPSDISFISKYGIQEILKRAHLNILWLTVLKGNSVMRSSGSCPNSRLKRLSGSRLSVSSLFRMKTLIDSPIDLAFVISSAITG